MCVICGKSNALEHNRACPVCYFKQASQSLFGTKCEHDAIRGIWEQSKGVCPYTGLQLTLGLDATIDHIVPHSLGGPTVVENLQWVHKKANQAKWNYMEEEFLELVRLIASNRLGMK
jgi:5-methylcytosine-specific restriction endonuclease McrA